MEALKKFIPTIIGVVLIGVGVYSYFRAGELTRACTEKAVATVVDMREDIDTSSEGMRYMYYPIVNYEANGQTVEKELGSGSNTPAYHINDKIDILYNPSKVDEFIVAGENQNVTWIIFGGLGIVFLGVGIYMIVKK